MKHEKLIGSIVGSIGIAMCIGFLFLPVHIIVLLWKIQCVLGAIATALQIALLYLWHDG